MQKIERSWKDFESCIIKILFITSNMKVTMMKLAVSKFFNTVLKPCVLVVMFIFMLSFGSVVLPH